MLDTLINEILKKIITVTVVSILIIGAYGFYLHVTETKNLQLNSSFYSDYDTRENLLPKFNPEEEFSDATAAAPAIARLELNDIFRCTTFIISNNYAITANHCVVSSFNKKLITSEFEVVSEDRSISITARAVGGYSSGDLALLYSENGFVDFKKIKIDASYLSAPLALQSKAVAACGFPRGTSKAVCYRQSQCGVYYDFVECQGLLYHGMSGGPLIILDAIPGERLVVGVNAAMTPGSSLFALLIGLFELLNIKTSKE